MFQLHKIGISPGGGGGLCGARTVRTRCSTFWMSPGVLPRDEATSKQLRQEFLEGAGLWFWAVYVGHGCGVGRVLCHAGGVGSFTKGRAGFQPLGGGGSIQPSA